MKKIISMLLVVAMVVAMTAIGVVSTGAAATATVTVYDLNGNAVTEQYNVGEEFTVYTTLDVSASVASGMIGSVQGTQTYTSSVLALADKVAGEYGEFVDLNTVFPITRENTIANAATAGKITYNASIPYKDKAFKFNSADSKLMVTTYKVTAAGTAEIKNAIKNLAIADDDLTRIVYEGKTQTGKSFSIASSFTDPVSIDHAEVTVHSLDGTTETMNFNIGDTFTVYTTLKVNEANGMIGSVTANQKYTSSVLTLAETLDEEGFIEDVDTVFPIMGDKCMANASSKGTITYSASTPYINKAFDFSADNSQLITTRYTVKANGYADITNDLVILATAESTVNRLVFNGVIKDGVQLTMPASFTDPSGPAPTTLTVTIIGPDGKSVDKEFDKDAEFTVYTVLNTSSVADGKIANVEGTQTFTSSKLKVTDSYDSEYGEVDDVEAMFPILGDKAMATVQGDTITFSASKPEINHGFSFNSDKSKLIVTHYKATGTGKATINTQLKTLTASDSAVTKIVVKGQTQSGQSFKLFSSFTDPGNPTPEPEKTAEITIYGIDGKSVKKTFNVGDKFTVYSTFNASKAATNGMLSAINGKQTFTTFVLKETDAVDADGVVTNKKAMFPILKDAAIGRVVGGEVRYNGGTPYVGAGGFDFSNDSCVLLVTNYQVTAAGKGEIRDSLVTVAAADTAITRIVTDGKVVSGKTIGGAASFDPPTPPVGEKYIFGDVNGDGVADTIDATLVQRVATRLSVPYSNEMMMRGDIDGDGEIAILDATFIQRYATRAAVPYPVGELVG